MKGLDDHLDNYGDPANPDRTYADIDDPDWDDATETIADDNPIWAERDAIMFPAIENITVNDGAPYGAQWGYRYSEWPRTAGFFADQITESASAVRIVQGIMPGMRPMRPVPINCKAICLTHERMCALHLGNSQGTQPDEHTTDRQGNTIHLCHGGGWGHSFYNQETRP